MTFRWRTFGSALLILTAIIGVAWSSWYPPFYLGNDDVTIRMALEGRTAPGQAPIGLALLTHAALGWTVVGMERLIPALPWWDFILAGILLCGVAVLLALMWDALGSGWLARATVVGALIVGMAPLIASFQFTISATIAGGAAALLGIIELSSASRRRSVVALAVLLFVAGLLLRPLAASAGAIAIAVMSAPLVFARKSSLAHVAGIVATVGVFFLLAQYADGVLYRTSADWYGYYQYNRIVLPLLEWGSDLSSTYARDIRESVGWSANDWLMLTASLGVDPVVHGFERVSQAYQAQTTIVDQVGALSWLFDRAKSASPETLRDVLSSLASIATVAGALVAAYATRRSALRACTVFLLFFAFCIAVDATFDRLPWRLLGPLQVLLVAATVVIVGTARRDSSPLVGILALSIVVAMTPPLLSTAAKEAADRARRSQELADEVAALQQLSPSLVILYGSRFPREDWWQPFHPPPPALPAIALGWNNHNPQMQRFLADTGRQPLLKALCDDPSILIVGDQYPLDLVAQYVKEHFKKSARWTQAYAGSFPAWRCSPAPPPQSEIP